METAVEIRNPLIARVRQHLDVTQDDSGRFCLTVNQGGEFTATLLKKAIDALPPGRPFTLDTTPPGALDESVIGVIIARRNGQERALLTSGEGLAKLTTMRLVTTEPDGSPRFMSACSWQIENRGAEHAISGHPAMDILKTLADHIQELERPRERPILRAPSAESLITVDARGDTIHVTVMAPIRGEQGQVLQDYLRGLDGTKRVVVDLRDIDGDSSKVGHYILMAAKQRKQAGAQPLELRNIPESLIRVFNPSYGHTIGFTLSAT